jgi:hypothetical protein
MYIIVNQGLYLRYNRHGEVVWTNWRMLAHVFMHYVDAVEAVHTYGGDITQAQG